MRRGEPGPRGLTEADIGTHYARLRRQARRLVRHDADADDVVQDAMERAWRFRERFASEGAAGPWLGAITRRTAIDFLGNRREVSSSPVEASAAHERTEATVLRREIGEALDAAIGTLAPVYRDTIVLHDVLGYSSREIASRESLPYHTVRTHLFRARRALRDLLPLEDAA